MMARFYFFLFLFIFTLNCVPATAVFNWIFGSSAEKSDKTEVLGGEVSSDSLLAKIPFEIDAVDEKFLSEAEKFTSDLKLSQLDTCHHKIILSLKKSCVYLSEEEIAKLSVNLLNCQSAVEGRPVYPCTKEMSLKLCTRDMDQDTWNAYHIVSNRARAVCYGVRQLQFRAKTEMTIDKLVSTAERQLTSMVSLQDEQEKLGKMTSVTLETITSGHENLMQQQDLLKNAQRNIQSYVSSNLRELTREKALIASGQKELAEMTEVIKRKLDEAETQLMSHEAGRRRNHVEVVNDLAEMQAKARIVWEKIDNSTQKILMQHNETVRHYQEALSNLQRVNESVSYLLRLVEKTRSEIDDKLSWLTELAGGAENQLAIVTTSTLHVAYFLFGAIGAAFVSAPLITRVSLLVLVPLNALNEIRNGASLDFVSLTVAIVASALLHCVVKFLWQTTTARRSVAPIERVTSTNVRSTVSLDSYSVQNQTTTQQNMKFSDESEEESSVCNTRTPPVQAIAFVMDSVRKLVRGTSARKTRNLELKKETEVEERVPKPTLVDKSFESRLNDESRNEGYMAPTNLVNVDLVRRHLLETLDESEQQPVMRLTRRSLSRSSTPLRSGSPTPKHTCGALNKKGQRCRQSCNNDKEFCYRHMDHQTPK